MNTWRSIFAGTVFVTAILGAALSGVAGPGAGGPAPRPGASDDHDHSCDDPRECPTSKKGGESTRADHKGNAVNRASLALAKTDRLLPVCSDSQTTACLDFSLFGKVDFSVFKTRKLTKTTVLVIHNGGYTARMNSDLIVDKHEDGKKSGAHYTIQRDGRIYQHIGEEMITAHGNGANTKGIGVELNITTYKGTSCNSLRSGTPAAGVIQACAPTEAQYKALNLLIDDLVVRTAIKRDAVHLIGHCEARGATHGDPRAFDWTRIGLSNEEKKDQVKALERESKKDVPCDHYLPL
jgi:N-acetyl-anhydromuramyl-L-alanine amidase AmpD